MRLAPLLLLSTQLSNAEATEPNDLTFGAETVVQKTVEDRRKSDSQRILFNVMGLVDAIEGVTLVEDIIAAEPKELAVDQIQLESEIKAGAASSWMTSPSNLTLGFTVNSKAVATQVTTFIDSVNAAQQNAGTGCVVTPSLMTFPVGETQRTGFQLRVNCQLPESE